MSFYPECMKKIHLNSFLQASFYPNLIQNKTKKNQTRFFNVSESFPFWRPIDSRFQFIRIYNNNFDVQRKKSENYYYLWWLRLRSLKLYTYIDNVVWWWSSSTSFDWLVGRSIGCCFEKMSKLTLVAWHNDGGGGNGSNNIHDHGALSVWWNEDHSVLVITSSGKNFFRFI